MKKVFLYLILSLLISSNLFADAKVHKRKKCRWWKKHHATVQIDEYQSKYVNGYWRVHCWRIWPLGPIYFWTYNPGYWWGGWKTIQYQNDRGCPSAYAYRSVSKIIDGAWRYAYAQAYVSNNTAWTRTYSNYWKLRAGGSREELMFPPNNGDQETSVSRCDIQTQVEFPEEQNNIMLNIDGILTSSRNSRFQSSYTVTAWEAHSDEDTLIQKDKVFWTGHISLQGEEVSVKGFDTTPESLEILDMGDSLSLNLNILQNIVEIPPYVVDSNIVVTIMSDSKYNGCDERCDSIVVISPKIFLEGAYEPTTNLMRDDLRRQGILPLQTPYGDSAMVNNPTLTFEENEEPHNNIVDWVLVELRDKNEPRSILNVSSALVQSDGDIVALDGKSPVVLNHLIPDSYYVVIRHRNHLPIMSAEPISLSLSNTCIDFSTEQTPVYDENARVDLGNGIMGVVGGDANGDNTVNAVDENSYWRVQNGQEYDYYNANADFNLDGTVNAVDENLIRRKNNSKTATIPE